MTDIEAALEFISNTPEFATWDSRTTPEWFVRLASLSAARPDALDAIAGLDDALQDIEVFLEIADFTKFGRETIQPVIDAATQYSVLINAEAK